MALDSLFVLTVPIGIPVLPPETTANYAATMGLTVQIARGKTGSLPQHFADRLGWEEMVATIAQVYHSLPPEEQSKATIMTRDYGQAGAVDLLGREFDLPRAISGHNNYFLWGTGGASGEVVISIGLSEGDLQGLFEDVTQVATIYCDHCRHQRMPVYVARRLKFPIQEVWPQAKHYY
jgi:hypothetical protein